MTVYNELVKYFTASQDKESIILDFYNSDTSSPFLSENLQFIDEKFKIGIIDQFDGKIPLIVNYDSVVNKKKLETGFIPTLFLDSHIVSYIDLFVNPDKNLQPHQIKSFDSFLRFVSKSKFDTNIWFYYMESYVKTDQRTFNQYALKLTNSFLYYKNIDDESFLKTGELRLDQNSVDWYIDQHGENNLEDVAKKHVNQFLNYAKRVDFDRYILPIYAVLIKMVLIRKNSPKKEIAYKISMLYEFMENELGFILARELHFAAHYFLGKIQKLINIEDQTKFANAKRNLLATAWDCFLLRFPEQMIFQGNPGELIIGYICCAENKLIEIGNLFSTSLIFGSYKENLTGPTLVQFDQKDLESTLDIETAYKIAKNLNEKISNRLKSSSYSTANNQDCNTIKKIVGGLESELENCTE